MSTHSEEDDSSLVPSSVRALKNLVWGEWSKSDACLAASLPVCAGTTVAPRELWRDACRAARAVGLPCWDAVALVFTGLYRGIHPDLVAPILEEWVFGMDAHREEFERTEPHAAVLELFLYYAVHREDPEIRELLETWEACGCPRPDGEQPAGAWAGLGFHLSGLFRRAFDGDELAWRIIRDLELRGHPLARLACFRCWDDASHREHDSLAQYFRNRNFDCLAAVRGFPMNGPRTDVERDFVMALCYRNDRVAISTAFGRDHASPFVPLVLAELSSAIREQLGPAGVSKWQGREHPGDWKTSALQQEVAERRFCEGVVEILHRASRGTLVYPFALARGAGKNLGRSAVRDLARRRKRGAVLPLDEQLAIAAGRSDPIRIDIRESVREAGLTDEECQVLWRHILHHERYRTIAEDLGLSVRACAHITQRAKQRLEKSLRHRLGG